MFKKQAEPTQLVRETERVLEHLSKQEIGSEEYAKSLEHVIKLHKMKEEETPSRVSSDTMLLAATNILGILLIIRHEHVNVITSRAMGLVTKPK